VHRGFADGRIVIDDQSASVFEAPVELGRDDRLLHAAFTQVARRLRTRFVRATHRSVRTRPTGPMDHDKENPMSALHLIRDGMITAAELLALLLIAPVGPAAAAETTLQPAATRTAAARSGAPSPTAAERRLHLVDAALEMRFLGLLADVRVVQTVRNDTARTLDLGTHLPSTEASVDRLSITRDGRSLALLGGTDCGGDDDPDAGHVRASEDEAIADLMQLPPGRQATVEVAATDTLQPAGLAWSIYLPATVAPLRAQALLVSQANGGHVVVVPPADASGVATVTLRPASGPARSVELGRVRAGVAYVVPLADAHTLVSLAEGAIELEVVSGHDVYWTTLAVAPRQSGSTTLARVAD